MHRCALLGVTLLLAPLAGCGEPDGVVKTVAATTSSTQGAPPSESAPISLWLSAERVPVDGTDLVAVLVNRSQQTPTFGVGAESTAGTVPPGRSTAGPGSASSGGAASADSTGSTTTSPSSRSAS